MMHPSTFEYLKPTHSELGKMNTLRAAAKMYAHVLETHLPDGPDKTYIMRNLRSLAMWVNVALTRHPDGSPRQSGDTPLNPDLASAPHPQPGDLGSVPL